MATIRVFAEDDVPGAAALFARAYPEHRWASQSACGSYIREMLFNNPWRDPDLPSWVAEEDGRISGPGRSALPATCWRFWKNVPRFLFR